MLSSFKIGRNFGEPVYNCLIYAKFSTSIPRNKTSKSEIHRTHPWSTKADQKQNSTELPPLPVPLLSETIMKFLIFSKQVQPNADDFNQTLKVSSDFMQSDEVRKLQDLLENSANSLPNWLTPWWVNVAYLEGRTPLPIFTSPGMTLPKLDFVGIDGQIEYAAKIIRAALDYHHIIRSGKLPQETAGGVHLDMSQYHFMFGTTRIPRCGRDEILYGKDRARWSQHILVTRNGHSFQVNVYDKNGEPLSIPQIKAQLHEVVSQSEYFDELGAVNVLSTDNRDDWAVVYERIKTSSPNAIQSFEEALFVLSLDRSSKNKGYAVVEENMRQALHGGGTDQNTFNRWFDKALQFHINEDGYASFTYEHTPAEGPPFAALLDFVQDQLQKNSLNEQSYTMSDVEKPHRLKFRLIDEDKTAIRKSAQRINSAIDDLEVKCLSFDGFGKRMPKSAKMSPDSFIQIAMQLAFYNIHGNHPPTYETASLRRFAEGRTETIRLPNIESVAFVERAQAGGERTELCSRLAEAVSAHKNYSLSAMTGKGMDRHLLGLKLMCLEQQKLHGDSAAPALPSIYASKAYKRLMNFQISSSQVPTRNELPMGYGPSGEDCYAVCYNPREYEINFTITAFNSCERTSAERYARELENALMKMKDITAQ